MAETPATPPDALPLATVRSGRLAQLSLIWVIPLVAAIIGGTVAVKAILARGPTITIRFRDAEGLEAGKTKIRYRDVDVGTVRSIELNDDHKSIRVIAEMVRASESLLARDTRFWVVRPRVTGGAVSGLTTLLSGAYIGMDIGHADEHSTEFMGLEEPPAVASDDPGREFTLHAMTLGSLDVGSPVYYRHLSVGRITKFSLDANGGGVTLKVFINAPYDRFVSTDARFWHASGVSFAVSANGVQLDTESLTSILIGGIAFENPPGVQAPPAPPHATFTLARDRDTALAPPRVEGGHFVMYFTSSLRGLAVGAPVELHGVEVGEVRSISIEYDPEHGLFRYPVEIVIFEDKIRAHLIPGARPMDAATMASNGFAAGLVAHGLRAQLRTGNLLTGKLLVSLDYHHDAKPVKTDPSQHPMELPTVPGGLDDLQDTLNDVAKKIDAMPLTDLGRDADATLVNLRRTLASTDALLTRLDHDLAPQMQATLEQARSALTNADRLLDSAGGAPGQLDRSLDELTRAARSLADLAQMLQRHPEALLRGRARERTP